MKILGIKQFGSLITLTAASVAYEASNNASAQEKVNNPPMTMKVNPPPKTAITIVNKSDGTKIIEESDFTGFIFKRITERQLEKGNVTETTVENFYKETGSSSKEVKTIHKNGLSEKYQSFINGIPTYFHLTTRHENKEVKEEIFEHYDNKGFVTSKGISKCSEDGKKINTEGTDGFGIPTIRENIEHFKDGYNWEQKFYDNKGGLALQIIKTGLNESKIKRTPPEGNNPNNQKKIEIVTTEIAKAYDGQRNYEGKMITKTSTDGLTEIAEIYDSSNKLYAKRTEISEYRKDKKGKYREYPYHAKEIEEEINKDGICVHKNETQYREDNSTKIIDEVFFDKGKLQSRVTQEEIRAQMLVETRIEEFDENGKKTKDERTFEPIK